MKKVSIVLPPILTGMEPRERILKAAKELFFRFGIKSVTMDDIAKHLAMSKKTIYQFFEDKDQIVRTLTSEDLQCHKVEFSEIKSSSKDPVHEIFSLMKMIGILFSQMNPNVFYDMQKYHPKAWQMFRQFKDEYMLQMVEENLKRGISEGLYRQDINTGIIARLRIQEVDMGLNPFVFPPEKYTLPEVQVALLDHFLHGITTLKGHKLINKYKQVVEEE